MRHYQYLIIGGGMTADAAVRGIRELDASGSIGLLGAETDAPYARPPLSKALWKGEPFQSVWRKTAEAGVDLHLGRRATSLDLRGKRVSDDGGGEYTFDKLLLATGGTPRRLPFGSERVIYFRTLEDYRRLRALATEGKAFAVIGGGFIGSEITAALAMQGCKVTMLFPEEGIAGRLFPADLARFLVGYYREKGVDARPGERVIGLRQSGPQAVVETRSGLRLAVDAVVAGLGIVPDTDLATAAGLEVEDGVVVGELLQTAHPDVFAAGDVARFFAPTLGTRIRVEHEDNALSMGRAAGRAMAGDSTPYDHLPFFYSDLFDLGYEAVGELDPRGETVADWKEPFREGVVYYLADGGVRGVLLWNTWGQVDAARALIAQPGPFRASDLVGLLPAQ
ncbi:MAG TPA: FAD-dependent oxidoreductase [Gemmatimonadales bacterium]|jgi:NADPH-dependent 2,4-dienoyl-CoA reductase/sulfur reductase-like enzyme|nr:FAD-dependent oxidoreductase [Gemmatimonadales bacterium]